MKTCQGNKSKWCKVLPLVFWAERVTIRRSTGYSPYYMVHGIHPLLPFDILEATYLSPPQDFYTSTEDLVATHAQQLAKCPKDITKMHHTVTESRRKNLERFEKHYTSCIINFDFKPGALVLVRNSRIEESLNHKTKPWYTGPVVVICKTPGTLYIVTELNGTQSQLHVAGFQLIPHFPCTQSLTPIISNLRDNEDYTEDDPEDIEYLTSLASDDRLYHSLSPPSF